jgi:hypothetical protein
MASERSHGLGHHTFRHTCAALLFTKEKWNAKQVQAWLGHHSPEFTLKTYVDLLEEDMPELSETFGEWGNKGATQPTETDINEGQSGEPDTAQTLGLARAV